MVHLLTAEKLMSGGTSQSKEDDANGVLTIDSYPNERGYQFVCDYHISDNHGLHWYDRFVDQENNPDGQRFGQAVRCLSKTDAGFRKIPEKIGKLKAAVTLASSAAFSL